MTSSALNTLLATVNDATNPASRAEALANVGLCLAQLGRCEEAKEILTRLRSEYPSGAIPRVAIKIMILDGVLPYYQDLRDSADRLRRACALASAAGMVDLAMESHIWIAHLAFNFDRYEEFGRSIAHVFEHFFDLDESRQARACLLVADGLQYLGDRSFASEWYGLARILSRRVHDHAVMVAIEYNRLGMGLSRIRAEWAISGLVTGSDIRNWLLEFESVRGLHLGFDAHALDELLELCDAYSHEARGDYRAARTVFARICATAQGAPACPSEQILALELHWCDVMSGDAEEFDVSSLMSLDSVGLLPENERLMALFFIKSIADRKGFLIEEERFAEMFESSHAAFRKSCAEIGEALSFARKYLQIIKTRTLG